VLSFGKANDWIASDCWLACFDILGFKNLIDVDKDDFEAPRVRAQYEETLRQLRKKSGNFSYRPGDIDYCWFSDTFLMYCPDDSPEAYGMVQSAAKHFMHACIYSRIPMRGAIAVGSLLRSPDKRSFVGKGFLEAYEYAVDQDWIGLLLTPSAIKKIESYGSSLIYDFVRSNDIPMRKLAGHNVLAYRFQDGAANYPCPLLPMLNEMKVLSEEQYRPKYERMEKFIEKHYSRLA
jgi:hypothetical protein